MSSVFPLTPSERWLLKNLGVHGDIAGSNTIHSKVDAIKADTNTIVTNTSNIPSLIGTPDATLSDDIRVLNGMISALDTDNSDVMALLEDASIGLSAISRKVFSNSADIGEALNAIGVPSTTLAGDISALSTKADDIYAEVTGITGLIGIPASGNVSADLAAILSAVGDMQNNTRTAIALLGELELPPTGQEYLYTVVLNNFDTAGNMADPDSAPTVSVVSFAGADRSGNLTNDAGVATTTMIKDSDGRYHIRYKVTDAHLANEGLLFTFTVVEGGVARSIDRVTRVVEEVSTSFTTSDRVMLGDAKAGVDAIVSTIGTPASVAGTVSGDIAEVKAVVDMVSSDVSTLSGDINGVNTNLENIKNKDAGSTYDPATDSLEAISEKLDAMSSAASNSTYTRAVKASGGIAQGANELVVLEAVNGVGSPFVNIKEIRVVPRTNTSSNFTVELFEDAAATMGLMKFEEAVATKGDLRLLMDMVYINRDATPAAKIYVKITNVTDSSTTIFDVEIRGINLAAA